MEVYWRHREILQCRGKGDGQALLQPVNFLTQAQQCGTSCFVMGVRKPTRWRHTTWRPKGTFEGRIQAFVCISVCVFWEKLWRIIVQQTHHLTSSLIPSTWLGLAGNLEEESGLVQVSERDQRTSGRLQKIKQGNGDWEPSVSPCLSFVSL